MRSWEMLWILYGALLGGVLGGYNMRRLHMPTVQINCFEIPAKSPSAFKTNDEDWRGIKKLLKTQIPIQAPPTAKDPTLNLNEVHRRYDLFQDSEDIAREHAKLVQDINSLRQVVFISPWTDDIKDYEDTIYQEIIETSTTTTRRPSTVSPVRVTRPTGIPVLLLGGASQRFPVKATTMRLPRPTISLVGSSATPQITKHPYPFVGLAANSLQRPAKLCIAPTMMPLMYPTTRRPTLWERFVSFLPRLQR